MFKRYSSSGMLKFAPLVAFILITGVPGLFTLRPAQAVSAASNSRPSAADNYGKLPLSFIANAGQIDPAVRFQVRNSSGTLSFEPAGVLLSLPVASATAGKPATSVGLQLQFENANPDAIISGADKLPGTANFFIGNDPNQWHTNVPTYGGVIYRELYPGVDLQYGGHVGLLKGTYTLAAGADLIAIRWRYSGAESTQLDPATGNLTITGRDGITLTEQAPVAWQMRDGVQAPVTVSYQIAPDGQIGFSASGYDRAATLTIDPGLVYSTYLGGSDNDSGQGIAVDSSGNAYITGITTSTNFPTTPGAIQTIGGGTYYAFVSKLAADGKYLLYSTYLGSSGLNPNAFGHGIAVDSSGNAYVTGDTTTGFPITTGAFQTTFGGGVNDVFVSKLAANGQSLLYSTYLGGTGSDAGQGIAVDSSDNTYITGFTDSTNFPITVGAFQTTLGFQATLGGSSLNAFVSKLAIDGKSLLYSTYLGGSSIDQATAIAIDISGNAYVTGRTTGVNFPTTAGAFQTTHGGGGKFYEAFVSKLSTDGKSLLYSTYLGGATSGIGIAVDTNGNAYVTGYTTDGFSTTPGALQTTFGGNNYDAFVSKLAVDGKLLLYSTYLGGTGSDAGQGIAVDSSGNAYVTGYTTGSFPTTVGALQTTFGGNDYDTFVSKLAVDGKSLLYSTYLGGTGSDAGRGIAVDSSGNAYVAGYAQSINFPTITGAYQMTFGGIVDAFVSKLDLIAMATPAPMNAATTR